MDQRTLYCKYRIHVGDQQLQAPDLIAHSKYPIDIGFLKDNILKPKDKVGSKREESWKNE
jgi:hypothetical protein